MLKKHYQRSSDREVSKSSEGKRINRKRQRFHSRGSYPRRRSYDRRGSFDRRGTSKRRGSYPRRRSYDRRGSFNRRNSYNPRQQDHKMQALDIIPSIRYSSTLPGCQLIAPSPQLSPQQGYQSQPHQQYSSQQGYQSQPHHTNNKDINHNHINNIHHHHKYNNSINQILIKYMGTDHILQ